MKLFNKKKCQGCGVRVKKGQDRHEVRVNTTDGLLTMWVCDGCADFLDQSADFFLHQRKKEKDD